MKELSELGLRNRRAVPMREVREEPIERFRDTVIQSVADGWRLVTLFGMPESGDTTRLLAILADDARGQLGAATTVVGESYLALTPDCAQAEAFEREIAEQCAVLPVGHPWLKPLRRHAPDHRPAGRSNVVLDPGAYSFFRIDGEEVHEVAVVVAEVLAST